jgi:hypothetical protein
MREPVPVDRGGYVSVFALLGVAFTALRLSALDDAAGVSFASVAFSASELASSGPFGGLL